MGYCHSLRCVAAGLVIFYIVIDQYMCAGIVFFNWIGPFDFDLLLT